MKRWELVVAVVCAASGLGYWLATSDEETPTAPTEASATMDAPASSAPVADSPRNKLGFPPWKGGAKAQPGSAPELRPMPSDFPASSGQGVPARAASNAQQNDDGAPREGAAGGSAARVRNDETLPVTQPEQRVLALYTSMADALEARDLNCDSLSGALETLVRDNKDDLAALVNERQGLSAQAQAIAQQRIERAGAEELVRMRQALRAGIAKCPQNERLLNVVRSLATAGQ